MVEGQHPRAARSESHLARLGTENQPDRHLQCRPERLRLELCERWLATIAGAVANKPGGHLRQMVAEGEQVRRRLRSEADQHLLLRGDEQLVDQQAHQEADQVDRHLDRLASEQRADRLRLHRLQGQNLLHLPQRGRLERGQPDAVGRQAAVRQFDRWIRNRRR